MMYHFNAIYSEDIRGIITYIQSYDRRELLSEVEWSCRESVGLEE